MQNNEQSLLLIHRENYQVPKGQEQSVHCKIAKQDAGGNFIERPRLVHFGVKEFETGAKENLETMGYSIEILHHPLGRFSNVVINDKDAILEAKNAEIAELKEALEKLKEKKDETPVETEVKKAEPALIVNKGGRPRKEA